MIATLQIKTKFQHNLSQWQPATWEDYLHYRDAANDEEVRLFFNDNYLFVDMGSEGINHASITRLFTMLFFIWFARFPEQTASDLGGCLMEKAPQKAASPDLVLYVGEGVPQWQPGEPRLIDLNKWRVPDLVGEVADTTLASDLDEKKQIYAALKIPEYWVIDVQARRIFAFILQENGKYIESTESVVLKGLSIALLTETLNQLNAGTNITAAHWFSQAIAKQF